MSLNRAVGDTRGILACLAGFAVIAVEQGKFERAARLIAAVEDLLSTLGIRLLYVDKLEYDKSLAHLRTKLDEKTIARNWSKGRGLTLEGSIALALEETT